MEILGEGTVGLVKKCIDLKTNKICAVKIIKTRNDEIIENIKIEFKNLKSIVHENIIEVNQLLIDNLSGTLYLVMELFEGSEMFDYIIKTGSYSEKKAKFLFKQLLEGIYYLHKKGIVHRDLKPNNILVNKDGSVLKITDFNVAKFCADYKNYDDFKKNNYEMNTYTGTIAFRAPEMFSNVSYTESIDIWAAGCVLYTMLCGYQPFFSKYIVDLIVLIENCDFNFENKNWELVSENAKLLIRQLLVKDPKMRLNPKTALDHQWFSEESESITDITVTRNRIQTMLKKNKRRLTKTNIRFDQKRKSFNQDLKFNSGFEILVKKIDQEENFSSSGSNYNINDSYKSIDSDDEGGSKKKRMSNEIKIDNFDIIEENLKEESDNLANSENLSRDGSENQKKNYNLANSENLSRDGSENQKKNYNLDNSEELSKDGSENQKKNYNLDNSEELSKDGSENSPLCKRNSFLEGFLNLQKQKITVDDLKLLENENKNEMIDELSKLSFKNN